MLSISQFQKIAKILISFIVQIYNFYLVSVWKKLFLLTNFTIQFIFFIIHGSHFTISVNIYFYLQYYK